MYGEIGDMSPSFLTPALDVGEWSASCADCFTRRILGTNSIGGWVVHRSGLDDMEKSQLTRNIPTQIRLNFPILNIQTWKSCELVK
jgi:hypothetical protein